MKRYALPQPYEELDHTADAAVRVTGESAEQTLARLALAMSQLLTGGGKLAPTDTRRLEIEAGDRASMAIDVLRELLYLFDSEHLIAASCAVERFDPTTGTTVEVELGPLDPDAHAEGTDLKAVTLHEARFEQEGEGWVAQVVFDV